MTTLADVMPAACAALGVGKPTLIPTSDHVVVLLIDGMGYRNLQDVDSKKISTEFLTHDAAIYSTFPTTTPVSLASLGTGLLPGEHGFVGATFELEEFEQVLRPLKWEMSPPPIAVQPEQTWFEKAAAHGITVNRLGPETYAESGLTQAVLRGGQHRAAENLQELMDGILEVASKPGLTYAYYPKLDKTGHIYGVNSVEWRKVASKVVAMIARTRESLPANTTLVVTADHGMIDIENRVWIEDRPSLMRNIRLITGEPRLRHVFAESGSSQSLLNEWKSLEDVAEILTRDEFIATRLLGDVADFVAPRIGDVVAIAREANALASRTVDERVSNLIGQHGSRTDVEREVPLAVMAGYGRG